ncbi:DUF3576 domain-containing protein [Roseomonas sp. NAR14]|uniref:DUF3576 domain-containing protein n=1 Tax=Roseomonas acroporae TaxID=2937791 RepID=A0A9X2BX76_9PROT|nr:DUF3576 domain-containing protein [Roseomonas acroporae]MCK8784695.1 DUF3576 domain-containing protein [Roseomonas acroporae]
MARPFPLLALAIALPALAACGSSENTRANNMSDYGDDSRRARAQQIGNQLQSSGIVLFGTDRSRQAQDAAAGPGLAVNAYLWRATLDTLSFMPLASADPFGGVIITDWYSPASTPDERFKATAYVLGRQLRSDGIRITVFRQVRRGGQWLDAAVSNATGSELEDKVLARARELRSQSAAR